jgi:hypothetical protein
MTEQFALSVIAVVVCAFVGGSMLTLGILALFFKKRD